MADKMGRLALELISRAGFGHTFKALEGSSDATYVQALKEVVPALLKMGGLIPVASAVGISQLPGWLSRFLGRLLPYKDLHALMDLADTLHSTAQDIFEEKKAKFESGDDTKERKDLISILLRNNSTASAAERLTNEEVCAQIGTLIFAGTDTTSSAMARILYLLATHPEAQDRLRDELEGANWRDLDYDTLMALPYLDAICRETLRLYTPVPNRARRAATDTALPLQRAVIGADGRQIREVFIPKGTVILANLDGLNTDPTIWGEDSYDWKPERWLKVPLPASVLEARIPGVYSNSATFLAGQRACIGFKFAELEMKTILSVLIPTFIVAPPKTEEVVFRWGLIITPSVKGKEMMTDPRLPLMLSKV